MATKKTTTEEVVAIQPIIRKHFKVRVVGDTALITHQWSEKAKKQIRDTKAGKGRVKVRDICNPIEEGMAAAYWLTPMPEEHTEEAFEEAIRNGARFGIRAISFKKAGNSAAYRLGWVKNQMALRAAYFVETPDSDDDLVEIHFDRVRIREDNVRVGIGSADLRYRPEFTNWWVELNITYNANGQMKLEDILTVLDAGGDVGAGEWRPEKDGSFGRYHLDRDSLVLLD